MRAFIRLLLLTLTLVGLLGGTAIAASDQPVFGPQVFARSKGAPNAYDARFALPADVAAPYRLRIENGLPDGSRRVSSATVSINGIQLAGPNDFNPQVALIERELALVPNNLLEVRLASVPGSQLTLSVLGSRPQSIPVSLTPNPLAVTAGATAQLTVQLAPTPRASGSLTLTSDAPQIAGVPASLAYASGQSSVPVTVFGLSAGNAVVTARANSGSASGTVQVTPSPPTVASLLPPTLTVTQGSSATLKLTLSAAQAAAVRVELASSHPAIITVPLDLTVPAGASSAEFGLEAVAAGSAEVSARLNGSSAASQITVTPAPPTLVSLLPATSSVTLGAGATLQLTLSAAQATPTEIPLSAAPDGLLTVPAKVTIPAGQTTAPVSVSTLALGTAGIAASLNGSSVSAAVRIVPPAPAIVSLLPSPLAITQDATGTLTVKLNAQQLANTEIQLATDAAALIKLPASVTVPAGELTASFAVTGLAVGNAGVTASVNGTSQTAQLSVVPHPPQPVSLLPEVLPLQQGASGSLLLTLNAAQLTDTSFEVRNSAPAIIQAPAQLTVPSGQLTATLPLTALNEGSSTLTLGLNGGTVQATVTVTLPPPVPSTFDPAALSLPKGVPGTLKLAVTRAPASPAIIALESSDPRIAEIPATVTLAAGALSVDIPVIARSEGSATITARLNGGSATVPITVTAPELTALTLSPQAPTAYLGETVAFLLQGTYTDAGVEDVTTRANWTSSAPEIAGTASTGVAGAIKVGSTTITATLGSLSASTPLKVEAVPVLSLAPAEASLKIDTSLTLTVSSSAPADAGGLAVALAAGGSGSLSLPASVTIPAGQSSASFTVTALTPGELTLTAGAARRVAASAQLHLLPKIAITALTPASGPVGSPVTIAGAYFDPNPANNEVRFNGERAVIGSATANELKVIVPVRATSGPVTVTTAAGTATGPNYTVQRQHDFDLVLAPDTAQAPPGGSATVRVKLQSTGLTAYAHAATLNLANLPAGVTVQQDRASLYLNGEVTLAFKTPTGLAAGQYPVTISATGPSETGPLTRSKIATLDVLAAGVTTVSGRVLHTEDDRPFAGAQVRLAGQAVLTDASGYYRFLNPLVLGDQVLQIDGHTAATDTTAYPSAIAMPVLITAGKDNLVLTSYIQGIDKQSYTTITPGAQTSVTTPEIPNYSLDIPAGAVLVGWDGTPVTQINVRTVPADRLPIKPLPDGVSANTVYLYYFFREGGANPTQPIPVTMANDQGALPGEKVELWYYDESINPDPNSNQWRVMGLGTVSADGKSIVSDPGVGIPKFCCGATFARNRPPTNPTGPNGGDGKGPKTGCPVDLASGNNLPFQMRGFGINGLLPVNFNCQYRSTNPRIGLFGRGTSFAYDWSAALVSDAVIVVTPDGVKYTLSKEADGAYRANTGKAGALGWEVRATAGGRTLRFPQGGEMDFNAGGNLVALRDAEGHRISVSLNGNGFVNGLTDANGRSYTITTTNYTSGAIYPLITSVTDALGRVVKYSYDASGRLATHTDAAGNLTRYDYDASHRVIKRTLPTGGAISFEYDSAGRTVKETLEDGVATLRYAYQTVGSVVTQTTVTDPRGNTTEYRFNGQGYDTRVTDALGRVTSKTLDPATNLVTAITDPVGRITRYAYDAKGKVTQVTDPAGNVTKLEYDPAWNKPTQATDALGNVTTFSYGEKGRLIEAIDATAAKRSIAYTFQGQPRTITDPLGRSVTLDYDSDGNLISITDPLGNTTRRHFDDANRLIGASNPLGHSTGYTVDTLDRMTQTTDATGGITTLAYDALDRLTSLTDPRGNPVERRTYNQRGQLAQTLDAANRATTYEYDTAGNLTQVTDRKGQVTTAAYDALNRPIEVSTADGRITTTEYDLAGNIAAIRDNRSGDLLFGYDSLDRLIRVVSDQGTVDYEYDALGRRTKRTINGGDSVAYSYDAASRLTRIDYRGKSTTYTYDAAGRLIEKTMPNGMKQKPTYDDADRLTEIKYERSDASVLETVGYTYDAAGRRTSRSATVAGVPETPIEATYDQSNRLASLSINGQSYTVAYDDNGNLKSKTAANGEMTSYAWDAGNQLIGISGPNLSASFNYDALGRRIEKTVNGDSVQYLYDGGQAIAEIRGNAISANLLTGLGIDEAIARYTDQGERTQLTDALGSVIVAAKEDGAVQTAYGYSPYGETQTMGTEEGNSTQFTGRENDNTGLYYYRARYYDPVLKAWLSEDPIGIAGGINNRVYVGGNPISIIDPRGLDNPGMGPYDPPPPNPCPGYGQPKSVDDIRLGGGIDPDGCIDAGGGLKICVGPGAMRAVGPKIASAITSGLNLNKALASQAQMGEAGTAMAGPGARVPFRDAQRVASEHGGNAADWVKKSSSSHVAKDGATFETHWVENVRTGQRVEFKTKFPGGD